MGVVCAGALDAARDWIEFSLPRARRKAISARMPIGRPVHFSNGPQAQCDAAFSGQLV